LKEESLSFIIPLCTVYAVLVAVQLIEIVATISCTIVDAVQEVLYDDNLSRCNRKIFVIVSVSATAEYFQS